ncbi:immunity 49 family protein [Fulvivirga ligni]|uniref:immunity 49 family protein n=1 Tax=Fulvivirga ligni TaxID=2904246 RepID=UPI001F34ACAC|nr:immunity 49 family protein [Fulvivirga ligni]UII22707.1 immunity 49 family protein [Fulvivirga ligni]
MVEFSLQSREERLLKVCQSVIDNEDDLLQSLKSGKVRIESFKSSKWYDHQRFALKSFFLEGSLLGCRQHFYTCGRLDEHLINNYDSRILEYGMAHVSYALLSDHQGLINRYAHLRHSGYDKITKKGSIIYAIQLAIKDELEHSYVDILDALSQKKRNVSIQPDVTFFRALIEKDKSGCEVAINELLTPRRHKQRNKYMELVNEFISHPALGYAKLAWLKGVMVELDNPLIPNVMLPVRPNSNYKDEYDFLK